MNCNQLFIKHLNISNTVPNISISMNLTNIMTQTSTSIATPNSFKEHQIGKTVLNTNWLVLRNWQTVVKAMVILRDDSI